MPVYVLSRGGDHLHMLVALCWRVCVLCVVVILITLVGSFISWHASLILKRNFYVTGQSYCYSLGMVKMEAFDDSHFMHQNVRGGHTDHTGRALDTCTQAHAGSVLILAHHEKSLSCKRSKEICFVLLHSIFVE